MKIGVDASRYSSGEATGVEFYSWYIINHLIESVARGGSHELILYSGNKLKFDKERKALLKKVGRRINCRVLPARRLWTLKRLSKEMKENPPEILFVPSHVLPLALPKKSVVVIHDVAFMYLRKSYSRFAYHYLNWSTKFAVRNATTIIVPSEATKRDLIHFFGCPEGKVEVVHHGFEVPDVGSDEIEKTVKKSEIFRRFGIDEKSGYLLFVGRLESKKNLVRLVEAFAEFSEAHDEYRLILAGKRGVGFFDLLKAVKRLKLFDKVIMPGYVTEEEKAALYKYCSVFVFPSLYEGFGFPILEAFHYRKPVLTSHLSCIPEVAGDGAYYVDPYDSASIAIGLEKLVVDEKYANKLVCLGSARLKLFRWKDAARKTLKILTK